MYTDSYFARFNLPEDVDAALSKCQYLAFVETKEELDEMVYGPTHTSRYDVTYQIEGRTEKEAEVVRCKNGASVNFMEDYMRRRDPNSMVIGDDLPSDKPRFKDRFGYDFSKLKAETLEWLSEQTLLLLPFRAGANAYGYDSLMICPVNAAFFALALANMQGFVSIKDVAKGYTPRSIRNFCERVGVAKSPNTIPYAFLEFCLREDLNETAQRVMAVLKPVKLTITNYPEGKSEMVTVENNPNRPEDGTREVSFSRHLWIEQDDFLAEPIPRYKRLYPNGPECRLKGAYLITCTGCVKDENGNVVEILATYDPESRGGDPADGRKVKGATIHWVDAENCCDAEVRQYDNLFNDPDPDAAGKDFLACLNEKSLEVLTGCKVEASLRDAKAPASYQFMRLGYFCPDSKDCAPGHLVFNRSVSLKDSFKPGK